MPNYITHWLIADRTASGLKGTVFQVPVEDHRHCLLIGAVFHDALFYLPSRSPLAPYRNYAQQLHGESGEDTLGLVRGLLQAHGRGEGGPRLLAFTAGLVCHIISDAVFHPFVFFHTGRVRGDRAGSASRATQAHRRLESALDLYFAGGLKGVRSYSLRQYLDRAGPWMEELYALAGRLLTGPGSEEKPRGLASAFRESMTRFAKAQVFFQSSPGPRLLYNLRRLLPGPLQEIVALGHHGGLKKYLPLLRVSLSYRHPVTGQEIQTTMEDLFNQAVDESVRLSARISDLAALGGPWPPDLVGPGLSSGLPQTPASSLREFAPQRLLGPGGKTRG